MKEIWLAVLMIHATACTTAFSGDDKFLKKYAMMKVYESCFGQEVVKEIRMEMKAAASKCAGISPSAPGSMPPPIRIYPQPNGANGHGPQHKIHTQLHHSEDHQHSAAQNSHQSQKVADNLPEAAALHATESAQKTQSTLDLQTLQKLQQAIAGYSTQVSQHHQHQPAQTYVSQQPYIAPQHHLRPYHHQPYQPAPPAPIHNSLYYPQPAGYQPQLPYMPNPYPVPYQQSLYQPAAFPSYYQGRSSRDLDVRGQLETLTNRMSGKIRNVTCVMQELGYLDSNLEPDYGRMTERIGRLPVSEDLRKDMAEGVEFCRQFSQCVPDDRKDKLIQEMVRPMFFFRCYKHKKLEACIMKDVRERYNQSDDLTEDTLSSDNRAAKEFPEDNMATAIYEFLYGDDNIDIDTLL